MESLNKIARWILLIAAIVGWIVGSVGVALADEVYVEPFSGRWGGCREWVLCDDQTATGACVTGTAVRLIDTQDFTSFIATADLSDSTTAWTVKLYSRTSGYSATVRTLLNDTGDMTPSRLQFLWTGHSHDTWAEIGGTTTGGVTVHVKACQ